MATRSVQHDQFGELSIEDNMILSFPEGIIGFEHLHQFVLINDEESLPFYWLVSVEEPDTTFPVINQTGAIEDYLPKKYEENGSTVLAISCLKGNAEESYINLRSPIIINNTTQVGKQIILDDERWSFQHPLLSSSTGK